MTPSIDVELVRVVLQKLSQHVLNSAVVRENILESNKKDRYGIHSVDRLTFWYLGILD